MQKEILDKKPDAALRVYAVFFEMVTGDEGARGRVDPRELLHDPRVTVFWDEAKLVGRWYEENVTKLGKRGGRDDRVEWDAYFLYEPDAKWIDGRPQVASWGRTVYAERERLAQDLALLLGESPTSEP